MTLAGRNGVGKTTLLRMLAGQSAIDRGELSVAKGVRVTLHDQRPPRERGLPLREYLLSGCAEELAVEAELAELEARMAAGSTGEPLLARYARAQARLEARGGYLWRERASATARGLGFGEEDLDRSLATFSGGELTRASLARARATRELALGRAIAAQRAEIARMERFIERFRYKATKARQAQSRVKKLAKLERIERDPAAPKGLEFAFSAPARSARVIFELRDGRIEVGGGGEPAGDGARRAARGDTAPRVLLDHAELWLERGEHVSLVGANGAGKTTLIETLTGRRALAAGTLSTGHSVNIGYLSQHGEELGAGGPPGERVLEVAQNATGLTP